MHGSALTRRICGALAAAALVASLAACTGRIHARGNLPDADRLSEVTPGEMTRDEVAEVLGSPSSVAAFGDETWFYISEVTETVAFFQPEIQDRKVVIIRFDKEGVVKSVETKGVEAAKAISPVDRKTPTVGKELTVLEQLMGNFNRIGTKQK